MFDLDESKPDYFSEPEEEGPQAPPTPGDSIDFGGDDGEKPPRRRSGLKRFLLWAAAICLIGLAIAGYLRYLNPYATDSLINGYITKVERRGIIFKTYEAEVISESALTDTTRLYSERLTMSIPSEALAKRLQALQGTGRRVELTTERFYGMLPWRGESTTIITAAEDK
ncbi:MAG: hypothetical protein NC342_01975 [Pseudoflavonifractor sp.]|nr:hypothetical protein [Alloprevotella sp.]MCM1116292.1 hypothetical protein [Pseudoflavonifractor sp.]